MANDGNANGAAAGTGTPPPTATWVDGLGDELKGYVTTKGFKEPKEVVESYRNFEKAMGVPKERLLTLPETLEGDAMNPVWERLGAVKAPTEYQFDVPADHVDEKFGNWAKETFHGLKVPRKMAEGFIKALNDRQAASLKEAKDAFTLDVKNQQDSIRKEWGAAYEKNEGIANQTAAKFGLTKEDVMSLGATIGPAKALKLLHKLGEGLGEDSFVQGGGRDNTKTPTQAQSEINSLIKDKDFSRRLQSGDVDAKARWDNLHKQAFQGQMTI